MFPTLAISRNKVKTSLRARFLQYTSPFDESLLSRDNRRVASIMWACGAAGSALPWHGRGHRFDPDQVHQNTPKISSRPVIPAGIRVAAGHLIRQHGSDREEIGLCCSAAPREVRSRPWLPAGPVWVDPQNSRTGSRRRPGAELNVIEEFGNSKCRKMRRVCPSSLEDFRGLQ